MAKQDVTVELFYSSVWNDHTSSALVRDQITITRGRANESSQPAPTTCTLTLAGWRFNPANPTSDLHGLIGRNTPIRVTVGTAVRFTGEVSSWTPRQSLGGSTIPPDRWVEVEAAGITRRLGQGADPLQSTLRRAIPASPNIAAYWPLDAGQLATVGQAVVGRSEFRPLSGNTRFGVGDLVPWLEPGLAFEESATMRGDVSMTHTPTVVAVRLVVRRDGTGGPTVLTTRGNTDPGGNVLIATFTPPDTVELQLNHDGSFVDSDTATFAGFFDGQPHHVQLTAGPINVPAVVIDGQTVVVVDGTSVDLTGIGRVELSYNPGSGGNPMAVGHLAVWAGASFTVEQLRAYEGYTGEHAGDRFVRLTSEEGISANIVSGVAADTVPCGPQYPDGLLAILREAADVDQGTLNDRRSTSTPGIHYRTGRSHYNRDAVLALDYAQAQVAPPLDPVVDDQGTRNDVTASRRGGGEARAVDQASIDAVGRYDSSVTVNCLGDGHALESQAGWRLHLGAVGGTRFPQVTVDLDATPALVAAADAVDVGNRATIANLPAELTPDLASLLVLGYTETIGSHRRRITFNTTPEEPYHIAEVEHPDYSVIGAGAVLGVSSVLGEDLTETETDVGLALGAGPDWVHEADFDILAAGEKMTVTAVAAAVGTFPNRTQVLTVVRSVNGVVKTHPVSPQAPVDLFHKSYIGL